MIAPSLPIASTGQPSIASLQRASLRGLWLLINVAITPVVVAFETGGGRFAAQIAVDALIIDVECSRCVFSVFVCDVRHSFLREK